MINSTHIKGNNSKNKLDINIRKNSQEFNMDEIGDMVIRK